jgi:AcrR family transcriptional regulator
MDLADAGGIDSLTMRRLGQTLGVEAMSLYNHVANKDDILNGILEMAMQEIELPPDDADWKHGIRITTLSAYQALLRHPWAAGQMMAPNRTSPARFRWMDAVCGLLRRSGFSVELTHYAYHVLDSHIVGFTLWLESLPAHGEELRHMAAEFILDFPADEYPHLAEHIAYHLRETDPDAKSTFEFGLDLILDGLERSRDA